MRTPLYAAAALCGALFATAAAAQDKVTVYKGARIWPGGAEPIDNGVLVVAGGKVQAIGGPSLAVPAGAVVVDVAGRVLTPGLFDAAYNRAGNQLDLNEQGDEVTPHMHVLDALDPGDKALQRARRAGVTAVNLLPGTLNVISGLGAVVKTAGSDAAAMVVKNESALRMTMGSEPSSGNRAIRGGTVDSIYYRRPTTRMGVVWEVRKAFYETKDYMARTIANGDQPKDPAKEVLARALQKQLTVFTTARAEQDIRTALRLAEEFGYTTVVDDATEAHFVVDELAAAKVWVLIGAPSAERPAGGAAADGAEPRLSTLRRLAAANVPFVITTGSNPLALDLVREAMFAVRDGLTPRQALDAVTVQPARLLGLEQRLGSLAVGHDADFVVWSTDPLDPAATATTVVVDGNPVSESR